MKRRDLIKAMIGMTVATACGQASSPTPTPASGGAAPTATKAAASTSGGTATSSSKFKVAFVYPAPVGDAGWSWAHDQGRQEIQQKFPDIETAYQENVPENPADAERVIRDFARKGFKIIVTCSFGYMDSTIKVAQEFPDTVFIHISGYKTAKNVGTAFGKIEEPRYVSGMLAGKMTKRNVLGYVAAFPIPEVIRGINAFTLGVRAVNPAAKVKVVWTNTWYDPQKERQAAESLIDSGADVVAQHQDSPATQQAAEARNVYGIGYDSDMHNAAPHANLTSPIWHWGVYYTQLVQQVKAGTWKSEQYWGGWKDGIVDLAPLNTVVPADIKQQIEAEVNKFKSGEKTIFTVFAGPLKDQQGQVKVPQGQSMTGDQILNMNWFVEGVEGTIPQ